MKYQVQRVGSNNVLTVTDAATPRAAAVEFSANDTVIVSQADEDGIPERAWHIKVTDGAPVVLAAGTPDLIAQMSGHAS